MCNKCKMVLAHTILAMVGTKIARVKCNTCNSEHAFRGTAVPKPRKARKSKDDKPSKVVLSFQQRIEGKDPAKARKYNVKETFAPDDLLDHPTFGLGIVSIVREDKIDVAFKAFEKTLVHGRVPPGEAPPPKPGPAAKPVSGGAPVPRPASSAPVAGPPPSVPAAAVTPVDPPLP